MIMRLTRIDYDPNGPNGSVRACLQKKRQVSRSRHAGGISGIGTTSCCSFVTYVKKNGHIDNVFGNSRIRIPFQVNGADIRTSCVHGELSALWNAITDEDGIPTILEIYIEISPCPKCESALNNLLRPDQEILYSFRYSDQREEWERAAHRLCAG